ncbi:ATP-binding protein [Methylophaga thiooxydans]|uniref:ATP-binding protein n=1 Tax=Methylophaga thiooxydans TaxID=392484 RepID=UPI00235384C5|nr:ATP-binding protein [Methylophaga thiooxydans]
MTSIRSRLSIGLTILLAVLLLGQWLWLTFTVKELVEKQVTTHLQEETESLLANLNIDKTGQLQMSDAQLSSNYQRAFSGLYFVVETEQKTLYSRSLWDFNLVSQRVGAGGKDISYIDGPRQQPLLAVSAGYFKQGQQFTITVAENIDWMLAEKRLLVRNFSLVSAVGVLLLLLFQAGMIRQVLRPLSHAQRQLQKLAIGDIDKVDERSPDEIRPLLLELNRLTSSMIMKTRRSRQSLGNLAHRLKTQLTLLNQIADKDSVKQDPQTRQMIYQQTEAIRQVIDRELKRARVSGFTLPGKGVNLAEMLDQLSDTLNLIYQDKRLAIHWHVDTNVRFNGDREDIQELLGNLMDNACKWCQHRVDVSASMEEGLKIIIEDDGPGCEVEDLSRLTRRGFRADESKPGSGLGLAIVFDIVESYDGKLLFGDSEQGGLQVTVHLQSSVPD